MWLYSREIGPYEVTLDAGAVVGTRYCGAASLASHEDSSQLTVAAGKCSDRGWHVPAASSSSGEEFCICEYSWTGDICDVPASEAEPGCPNGCSEHGNCWRMFGMEVACVCDINFYGLACDLYIIPTKTPGSDMCSGHGTLYEYLDLKMPHCECDAGFTGQFCHRRVNKSVNRQKNDGVNDRISDDANDTLDDTAKVLKRLLDLLGSDDQ